MHISQFGQKLAEANMLFGSRYPLCMFVVHELIEVFWNYWIVKSYLIFNAANVYFPNLASVKTIHLFIYLSVCLCGVKKAKCLPNFN